MGGDGDSYLDSWLFITACVWILDMLLNTIVFRTGFFSFNGWYICDLASFIISVLAIAYGLKYTGVLTIESTYKLSHVVGVVVLALLLKMVVYNLFITVPTVPSVLDLVVAVLEGVVFGTISWFITMEVRSLV